MRFLRNALWTSVGLFGLAALMTAPAAADQLILDDLIVDGSLCVGFDCVNGESFGFDTIRIKENNLRIKAQDTSSTASFPSADWQITFNDSTNGGANKFSIDNITDPGGRTPLTIEAGAPSHSLYVDDGGRLGFGTGTPVADLHVKTGNTPTLRLEQDGSSGFAPQTWDVAGNEANFFIRDATNGSTLPIRLRPGAPSSALDIAGDGDVGFGTSSPGSMTGSTEASVHVLRNDSTAGLLVEDTDASPATLLNMFEMRSTGPMRMVFENTTSGQTWDFRQNAGGDFAIVTPDATGTEFLLTEDGDLTIQGEIMTSGSCAGGCDRVFAPDRQIESIDTHAESMWRNSHLPAVGPTPEDGPFNLSRQAGGVLNELEKAHIYIEQLHRRLAAKEETAATLEARLATVETILGLRR